MDPATLARRYRYLWAGEALSAIIFVVLLVASAAREGTWVNWIARAYGVGIVVWILVQAVVFWRWKSRLLAQGQRTLPAEVVLRFRFFKYLNWILIAAFPFVVLVEWLVAGRRISPLDIGLGMLFLLGAIVEQINYYHYQLMYFDSRYDWRYIKLHKRFRLGSIARMLTPTIFDHDKINL